jgi:hypothetical protein
MKTSCISHPERERLIIIRKWQVEFCDGNHCAAAVMSFFEYWHNWKLDSDEYNKKSNDVAEMHGDSRHLNEDVIQFHSMQEISDGLLNLYGVKSIADAIKLLESKNALMAGRNPNPKYFYDNKKHFVFYPNVCNEWLKNRYESSLGKNAECKEQKDLPDSAKRPSADGKNAALLGKNAGYIMKEINNKDNNQSLNARDDFSNNEKKTTATEETNPIIDALIEKGMSPKYFQYPDVAPAIEHLQANGASASTFMEAYDIALNVTKGQGFGMRYLAKAVENLLSKPKQHKAYPTHSPPAPILDACRDVCETNDLKNLDWMEEGWEEKCKQES